MERRGGGRLNKEASWRALFGGSQGGESLNKEASWRALLGGGEESLNKEAGGNA